MFCTNGTFSRMGMSRWMGAVGLLSSIQTERLLGCFDSRRKIPSIVWGYLRWSYASSDMKFAPESNSFEQLPHALWILLSDIARSTLVPNLPHGRCVRQRLRSATSHRANSGFHYDFRWIWLSLRLQERNVRYWMNCLRLY
jgi:hypothetical protein